MSSPPQVHRTDKHGPTRPQGFYPRLDAVVVYALTVVQMTGKRTALPAASAQRPAADYIKSPGAVAPREQ